MAEVCDWYVMEARVDRLLSLGRRLSKRFRSAAKRGEVEVGVPVTARGLTPLCIIKTQIYGKPIWLAGDLLHQQTAHGVEPEAVVIATPARRIADRANCGQRDHCQINNANRFICLAKTTRPTSVSTNLYIFATGLNGFKR